MLLETEIINDMVLVRVKEDRLTDSRAIDFRAGISEIVAQGAINLLLDLGSVKFLDSTGLGAIVSVSKMLGADGKLAVCGLTGQVRKVFQVTRMDTIFEVFDVPS